MYTSSSIAQCEQMDYRALLTSLTAFFMSMSCKNAGSLIYWTVRKLSWHKRSTFPTQTSFQYPLYVLTTSNICFFLWFYLSQAIQNTLCRTSFHGDRSKITGLPFTVAKRSKVIMNPPLKYSDWIKTVRNVSNSTLFSWFRNSSRTNSMRCSKTDSSNACCKTDTNWFLKAPFGDIPSRT